MPSDPLLESRLLTRQILSVCMCKCIHMFKCVRACVVYDLMRVLSVRIASASILISTFRARVSKASRTFIVSLAEHSKNGMLPFFFASDRPSSSSTVCSLSHPPLASGQHKPGAFYKSKQSQQPSLFFGTNDRQNVARRIKLGGTPVCLRVSACGSLSRYVFACVHVCCAFKVCACE